MIQISTVLTPCQINPSTLQRMAASSGWMINPTSKAMPSMTQIVMAMPTIQPRLGISCDTRALRRHPPDFPRLATPNPASPEPAKSNNNHMELKSCPPAAVYGLAPASGCPTAGTGGRIQANRASAAPPERNALQISSCRYWPCPSSAPRIHRKMPRSRKSSVPGTSMGTASQ